jgi:hypothetical protein
MMQSLGWSDEDCVKYLRPGGSITAAWMRKDFGWSQDDCDKYLPKAANIADPNNPDRPRVAELKTDAERGDYELKFEGGVKQGASIEAYDTGALFSKFMGAGWAIYVMDSSGRFFAAQHKVGLFHHSSFLAGGNVAGAGEIKIVGGVVRAISNKSGHYQPSADEMVQVFAELGRRGVDLSQVEYHHVGPSSNLFAKTPKSTAKVFYESQKAKAGGG